MTAQHLSDLLSGAPDEQLTTILTNFVNVVLQGDLPTEVREIFFGRRLIALQKTDGGIRPIAVGYTLRRLAANCANAYVIKRRSDELQPIQVGIGVSGGAEVAVHVMQRLVSNMPDDHVLVKLDFLNAYNSVRRDTVRESVADKMAELYRFTHASLACSPNLIYNTYTIESAEKSQQGDQLSGLEFFEAVHPTLSEGSARTKLGYVDDLT